MIEIKTFAPVLIPTLNRYEHLKRCIESLEKCTGHEFTDVMVALDYPPTEKYVAGWKAIDTYLYNKEHAHHFKSLQVFRRQKNYGVGGPHSNMTELRKFVQERYTRWIVSEDDNVFSPNFLVFINKGLERYKDDPHIYAITGYTHPYNFKFGNNNYYRHNTDMSAWGYGIWKNKREEFLSFVAGRGFKKSLSLRNIIKFKKHGYNRLLEYIRFCYTEGEMRLTDAVQTCYLIVNDMYMIVPTITKVRNIGWDGTGRSGDVVGMFGQEIADRHMNQKIDDSPFFSFEGDDSDYIDYNNKVAAQESDGKIRWYICLYYSIRIIAGYYLKKMGVKSILMKIKHLCNK